MNASQLCSWSLAQPLLDVEQHLTRRGQAGRLEAETRKQVAAQGRRAAAARAPRRRRTADARDARWPTRSRPPRWPRPSRSHRCPRLVADDITPEAAASLLAEQGGRLAIISAEGGIFDIIAGRYSNGDTRTWTCGLRATPVTR